MTTRAEDPLFQHAIVRLRARVIALVFGLVGGSGLFLITVWHIVRRSSRRRPNIELLNHYFPGYEVSWFGAALGLCYGFVIGAVLGWSISRIYNKVAAMRLPR